MQMYMVFLSELLRELHNITLNLCFHVFMEIEYCLKKCKQEEMFTSREEKVWKGEVGEKLICRQHQVVLWCCAVWVCDSSIWAPSRRSVLPHRLRCHNKITGGLLDSSFPQGFLLTPFFPPQSLERNISSFAIKYAEESSEKLYLDVKLYVILWKCRLKWILHLLYKLYKSIGEGLMFHFGKQKHYISLSFSLGFQILTWWIPRKLVLNISQGRNDLS